MKTLGIIGGISYHSTAVYYNLINQQINKRLSGSNAAKMILYSVNYNDFKQLQIKNDWNGIENMLSDIALKLEKAGADCILISCNAAHLIADSLSKKINVPFIHIAETTAAEVYAHDISTVALIGTKFTMDGSFFKEKLTQYKIQTLLPEESDKDFIHQFILEELSKGIINQQTKTSFVGILNVLKTQGAQAVILGCTELGMLVDQDDVPFKLFDTASIHCNRAVDFALDLNYTILK